MMDGVPSLVNVLFVDSVQSCVTAPELQEDWLGTKDEIGSSNIHLYNSNLHLDLVPQEILVTAPELQEDLLGTKVEKGNFNSSHLYLLIQNCKRIGLVQLLVMSIKSISKFFSQRLQEVSLYQFI